MNNHYAVLGVLPVASTDEIKASYRQLAKRFHPDIAGGNARFFARISEAYEILSDSTRRRAYDLHSQRRAAMAKPRDAAPQATTQRNAPMPVLTRIMSLTVPRSGRFQLEGLIGDIHVVPTTPETLWETTLRKYGTTDSERLARHVIQIKLSGEHELVRSMMPRPTDFGVQFEGGSPAEKRHRMRKFLDNLLGRGPFGSTFANKGFGLYGAHLPLTLQVTIPKGTPLSLRDITGAITVGNVESEIVAKMLGGVLRTGRISCAHLTLNGGSRAFVSDVRGSVDLMGFGSSRCYLGGRISRLRAVLENTASAEVSGTVGVLISEVNGQARLSVKKPVHEAHCDVDDAGEVQLARVDRLTGSSSRQGRVYAHVQPRGMSKAG